MLMMEALQGEARGAAAPDVLCVEFGRERLEGPVEFVKNEAGAMEADGSAGAAKCSRAKAFGRRSPAEAQYGYVGRSASSWDGRTWRPRGSWASQVSQPGRQLREQGPRSGPIRYSARNASTGSMRVARRAGRYAAAVATASNMTHTLASVSGSVGLIS